MAAQPTSQMEEDYPHVESPRKTKWLKDFKLSNYAAALSKGGVDSITDIPDLEEEDIDEVIKIGAIPKPKARKLRKAIAAVQSGQYKVEAEAGDEKCPVDEELMKLRAGRSNLKGYVNLPLNRSRGSSSKYRMFYTDVDPEVAKADITNNKQMRTAMFIGQTGAGKTTLIQSMTNYLMKVGYREPFRYELINENADAKVKSADKTVSQTVAITQYHMHNLPAQPGCAMTVVDTPGFGDTRGPHQDLKIRSLFKNFFEKVPTIDAIYFVIKASDTRVGAAQLYLFQMVLDLFGKDVKDNIFILFTFSDGSKPPALAAVKKLGVPFADSFQINNSGFGLPDKDTSMTHESFFNMGVTMFANIFNALSRVTPVSTRLSAKTLKERESINTTLSEVGRYNKTCLDKVTTATDFYRQLQKHATAIDQNADYEFEEPYIDVIKIPITNGRYTTFCRKCLVTCHRWCGIPNDCDKSGCWAIDSSTGYCTQCDLKCHWKEHKNESFYTDRVKKTRKMTRDKVLARFNVAKGEAANSERLLQLQLDEIGKIERTIENNVRKMKQSVDKLKKIALNDQVLTDDDYFDTLMTSEQNEAKPGWRDRVDQLKALKEHMRMLRDVVNDRTTAASISSNQELQEIKSKLKCSKQTSGWSMKRVKDFITSFGQ